MDKVINFFNGKFNKRSIRAKYLWIWRTYLVMLTCSLIWLFVDLMSFLARFLNYIVWGISI